ncbi:hypothetical protein JCM10213_001538 [Rhodosporidiobolus nylandii]
MPSLLDLPIELLDFIVEVVHAMRPKQYLGAVHRAFLPRARQLVFREVEVKTYERLGQFEQLVESRGALSGIVQGLKLVLKTQADPGTPKTSTLSSLFTRRTSVTELSACGSPRIAKLALSPSSTGRPLPSLGCLIIDDPLEGWSNPFDPVHYSQISAYRYLNWLELNVDRALSSLGRYKRASSGVVLELQYLGFQPWADISTADLLTLLASPIRPATLEKLDLNNVFDVQHYDEWDELFTVTKGWTQQFSKAGVAQVLDAAEKAGVKVVGRAASIVRKEQARRAAQASRS